MESPGFKNILLESEDDKNKAFEYTLQNFYGTAIIPCTLRLKDSLKEDSYLNEEISMFINSGLSRMILDEKGSIIATVFFTAWKAKEDYPTFDVALKDWFHMANRLATEFGTTDVHKTLIWRNYQLLFKYHTGQCLAQAQNKPWLIYPSLSYVNPEYRNSQMIRDQIYPMWPLQSSDVAVSYTVGTFPNFVAYYKKLHKAGFKVLDKVAYTDLELTMQDGRNIFEDLKDMDGITLVEHN